jgi:hypothetical protein
VFRTRETDDYGKFKIHLPGSYLREPYVLNVRQGDDTVYQKPISDTFVVLQGLKPGAYSLKIILDTNHNGHWDTGDLLGHRQPEKVISYPHDVMLKAGWEQDVDF